MGSMIEKFVKICLQEVTVRKFTRKGQESIEGNVFFMNGWLNLE